MTQTRKKRNRGKRERSYLLVSHRVIKRLAIDCILVSYRVLIANGLALVRLVESAN